MKKSCVYKKGRLFLLILIIGFLIPVNISKIPQIEVNDRKALLMDSFLKPDKKSLLTSSISHEDKLGDLFDRKLADFNNFDFFPQYYRPSLQATYHGLYVLNAIGRLDEINSTEVINYVMSHHDEDLYLFQDDYSLRYLDANNSQNYFPLNSLLETTCYGVLSLDLLGVVDLIDHQGTIEFIWSCFSPEDDGFIGQPYMPNLKPDLKNATMDNTFYALVTLDLLMDDWNGYSTEISRMVSFINSLQQSSGGFFNDHEEIYFDSLGIKDPNLLSAYYSIKGLEMLGYVGTIRIGDFHSYLSQLYSDVDDTWRIETYFLQINVLGSALGLALADVTGFTEFDREAVLDFVFQNRNNLGSWNACSVYPYHELMDTFQIIRALKESEDLGRLTEQEKDELAQSMNYYKCDVGFSPLSHDYLSLELVHSIVNAFAIEGRLTDLDFLTFYKWINGSYHAKPGYLGFYASPGIKFGRTWFRSVPIEYYCLSSELMNETNYLITHETTYYALDTMLKLYKLDDFAIEQDLSALLGEILNSQIKNPAHPNYGAFLPINFFSLFSESFQVRYHHLKYSYYAIKSLELLANFLELGNLKDLPINWNSLYEFVSRGVIETDTMIYYLSSNSSTSMERIEDTYYMMYILDAIDLLNVNVQKLENFLHNGLQYDNLKSLYFGYKIAELLDLDFEFDFARTDALLDSLYNPDLNEFYLTPARKQICQEAFSCLVEMAKNDELKFDYYYESDILLGSVNTISTSFRNIIRTKFGDSVSVFFDSIALGTIPLEKQPDDSYKVNLLIPESSHCYPEVSGDLRIYEGNMLLGQAALCFSTQFGFYCDEVKKIAIGNSVLFSINVSYEFSSGFKPASESTINAHIQVNNLVGRIEKFTREDFQEYSTFSFTFEPGKNDYYLEFIIEDDFHPVGQFLGDYEIDNERGDPFDTVSMIIRLLILGIMIFIALSVTRFLIRLFKSKRRPQEREKCLRESPKDSKIGIIVDDIFNRRE